MGAIFEELDREAVRYDTESFEKAKLEYISKYRNVPLADDAEVIKRASEIFADKIKSISEKYNTQTVSPKIVSNLETSTYDKEPVIPNLKNNEEQKVSKVWTAKASTKPNIPNISGTNKDITDDLTLPPIKLGNHPIQEEPKTIGVDLDGVKKKSVGFNKNIKHLIIAALSVGCAALVVGTMAVQLITKHELKAGQTGVFSQYEYDNAKWQGSHYTTWYELGKMGKAIVENSYNSNETSTLSIDDNIAMVFGIEAKKIVENPNMYGDDSKYSYNGASYIDDNGETKGWGEELYAAIKEDALKHDLELPDTLEEYLKNRQLNRYIYSVNTFNGEVTITEIDDLTPEQQAYYQSIPGMLQNLGQQGLALSIRNGRNL